MKSDLVIVADTSKRQKLAYYYKEKFGEEIKYKLFSSGMAEAAKKIIPFCSAIINTDIPSEYLPVLFDIEVVPESDSSYIFPIGHPKNDVLYISHPLKNKILYPASDFHKFTLEHKFAEAIRFLVSLGATEINVEVNKGSETNLSSTVEGTLDYLKNEIGIQKTKGSSTNISFIATLNPTEPEIPNDLLWYPHEPIWQAIATSREKMKNFSLEFNYIADFGINADIKTSAIGKAFKWGNEFKSIEETKWIIKGAFNPEEEK
ncbi:hypothetical protein [Bacillus paramycoides]|uniref:Uncharacterized protein n=1 Tax=Bacillus paramycoides TaxID=2026194 RepID=A0ABU6MV65_9BACI|nr:hypothetical protein [Bacillus paramycoides]